MFAFIEQGVEYKHWTVMLELYKNVLDSMWSIVAISGHFTIGVMWLHLSECRGVSPSYYLNYSYGEMVCECFTSSDGGWIVAW